MQTGAAMRTKRSPRWMLAPKMSKASPLNWGKGRSFVASGYHFQTACWSARERPIAVISGASRGAVRSGR